MKVFLKISLCMMAAVCISAAASGQVLRDNWKQEVGAGGGFCTNNNFFVEVSYFYFPLQWIGVGGYVGMNGTSSKISVPSGNVTSTTDYNRWILTPEHEAVSGLTFTPSVVFSTPALRINVLRICLRAVPGIVLTPPVERVEAEFREVNPWKSADMTNFKYEKVWLKSNHWWFWAARALVHFSLDEICVGAGYSISNYDIWATRREGSIEGTSFSSFYPSPQDYYHNFFLYFAWRF